MGYMFTFSCDIHLYTCTCTCECISADTVFVYSVVVCSSYLVDVITLTMSSIAPSDLVVGWQQLAQINMKAREQQVTWLCVDA